MEIITYNIQSPFLGISNYEERLDLIINKIALYNATVILFQEVFIMSLFTMKIFSKDNYIELLISYQDEPPLLTKNNLLLFVKVNATPPFKLIFVPPPVPTGFTVVIGSKEH